MNKFLKLTSAALLSMSFAACASSSTPGSTSDTDKPADAAESSGLSGTYSYHVGGYDWGAGVDKVIVKLSAPVEAVSKDTFTVKETKTATDWTSEDLEIKETDFDRTVEDAYLSDADGNKADDPSEYVTLALYVSPNDGSPINYDAKGGRNAWCDPYELTIALAEGQSLTSNGAETTDLSIDKAATSKTTDADSYKLDSFKAEDGTVYEYAYYEPEEETKTLFVWLHGGGEGAGEGSDPYVLALANKVTAYVSDEFQKTLGGAWVLAPQCPTLWMDNGHLGDDWQNQLTGESIYTASVTELIDSFANEHGLEKIVIAGCSNGGFMTVNAAVAKGSEYTAYVPICEGFIDTAITDDVVNTLKELPMFFIYSEDDDTLDPEKFSKPMLAKLEEAGAEKIKVHTSEHVTDTSGKYKTEDGQPYQYSGHWSWIYFDNNEADANDDGTPVWTWIADQVK